MQRPVYFEPDGNDLKRVFYYYGLEFDEQMLCPFHDDNNPSCHNDFSKGVFYCFACGAGGNAFDFVKLANPGISELNQLILYHSILNSKKVSSLKLSKLRKSKGKMQKQKEEQREIDMEIAYDYYFGLKTIDWSKVDSEYKDYMIARGFNSKALNMAKAKLTITDDKYPLIFPIFDLDTFRGYQCRTTNKHIEKKRKYLFSKGFSRIDTIGGEYRNKTVVLTEGFLDKIKLNQYGLKYVAAIFGWKITSQQISKLKAAGVETIVSALDMDKPGIKGTEYLKQHFDVVQFQFPKGVKDPGDLTEQQFKIAYRKTKNIIRSRRK